MAYRTPPFAGKLLLNAYSNTASAAQSLTTTATTWQTYTATSPYACPGQGQYASSLHTPVHGERHRSGEKHMRADDCVYCMQRIVSLHVMEPFVFDQWRGMDTVRPAVIIQEDDELF